MRDTSIVGTCALFVIATPCMCGMMVEINSRRRAVARGSRKGGVKRRKTASGGEMTQTPKMDVGVKISVNSHAIIVLDFSAALFRSVGQNEKPHRASARKQKASRSESSRETRQMLPARAKLSE
uniref:Secreted protein n=1 Tax=Panagrellus redivivus TaxID=6233 RepID=A0A7E4W0A0_PANRE